MDNLQRDIIRERERERGNITIFRLTNDKSNYNSIYQEKIRRNCVMKQVEETMSDLIIMLTVDRLVFHRRLSSFNADYRRMLMKANEIYRGLYANNAVA